MQSRIGAGGVDVSVETLGGGAEAVLFVHGLGSNRGCWYRAEEFLDLDRYRLILPDLPGFGDSARPMDFDYSMASLGDCLGRVVLDLGAARPHIVAHSMGCAVALAAVEVGAIQPASLFAAEGNLEPADAFMSARIARLTERDFLQIYPAWLSVAQRFWGEQPNEQHDRFIESLSNSSPIAMYRAAVSCSEKTRSGALASQFAALSCPVAYAYGEDSLKRRPIPEVARLPHVRRFAIPDQGHFMMQAADRFYANLSAFVTASKSIG